MEEWIAADVVVNLERRFGPEAVAPATGSTSGHWEPWKEAGRHSWQLTICCDLASGVRFGAGR